MGATFRFLHAADLQLDRPFQGVTRVRPSMAPVLRDASLEALDRMVECAVREQVAFVVLAGGLCEGSTLRGIRPQLRFRSALERLSEAGIQTLLALGRGDPSEGWEAIEEWPQGVQIFDDANIERVQIERDGEVLARVFGMSYPGAASFAELAELSRQEGTRPGLPIACLPCSLPAVSEQGAESAEPIEGLLQSGIAYWALGSRMQREVLHRAPWIVFPGVLQGRSFEAVERGPHGAYLVEVGDGRVGDVRFEPLDTVRTLSIELDIRGISDWDGLRTVVLDRIGQLRREHADTSLILRFRLAGFGPVQSDIADADRLAAFEEQLATELEVKAPGNGLDRFEDATQPVIDLASVRGRRDLLATVLQLGDAYAADPEALAGFLEGRVEPMPLPEIGEWLDVPTPGDGSAAVQKAVMSAIHELSSQGQED